MIAITYSLKKIDLLEFNEYHAKMTGVYGKSITRHQILWPFVLVIIAVVNVVVQDNLQMGMLFLIGAFIWSIIVPGMIKSRFHKHVAELYTHEQIAKATGKRTLSITDDGLVEKKDGDDEVMPWSSIEKFEQTKFYAYFYVSADAALIVPKEAITAGDVTVFIEQAIEKIKNSMS